MHAASWHNGLAMNDLNHTDTPELAPTYAKLLGETARISWPEIERLFAVGKVLKVAASLDLVGVGAAMAADNSDKIRNWMLAEQLGQLDDATALRWAESTDADLWALVVSPWLLVQERSGAAAA